MITIKKRITKPWSGWNWWILTLEELHDFLELCLLMEIKILLNDKHYWRRSNLFMHSIYITTIMSRGQFEAIICCLLSMEARGYKIIDEMVIGYHSTLITGEKLVPMRWVEGSDEGWKAKRLFVRLFQMLFQIS